MTPQAKIGLALSGGGMRGLAHIGVLQVLEEAHIPVDFLAGTSMGGIIAGFYAAGLPVAEMLRVGAHVGVLDIASPDPHRHGLLGHKKMHAFFADVLGHDDLTFADLQLPLALIASDIETGELVILNEGPLIPAMLATSAFPFMFGPVHHQGRWLVDGGVLNNFPVDLVRRLGADRVIGVDTPPSVQLTLKGEDEQRPRLKLHALLPLDLRSFDWKMPFLIAETSISFTMALVNQRRMELNPPDVHINVRVANIGAFFTNKNHDIIAAGYQQAQEQLLALRALHATPLPPRWRRTLADFGLRLQRAWRAYQEPTHPLYP